MILPLVLVVVCGAWCNVNILLYCIVLLLKIAAHNPKKWERYLTREGDRQKYIDRMGLF
jgi:hypothetical protein